MQTAKVAVMQDIRRKQKADEQANQAEWLEERISIMTADGGLTEFQALQECQKLLQCRNTAQKEFTYGKISDTH